MARSRRASNTNAIVSIVIVLGILVIINFVSYRHFSRVDLTETKQFTITPSTRNVLARLDDVVNIRVYFTKSSKLPSRLVTLEQEVRDVLEEYRAYGGGNLDIQFIDPEDDPESEQVARQLGIQQIPLQVIEKDKMQVLNAYLGIAVLYSDRKEVMPQVLDIRNLEYELTSRILKVSRAEQKTVGFLQGHGERSLQEKLTGIKGALEEQYRVIPVEGGSPIPADVTTLVIAGPKAMPERDVYEVDQFIMRGGKVVFLIDVLDLVEGMLQARIVESGLEDLLKHYGVSIPKELVLDQVNVNAAFNMGFMTFSLPYPFWPRVLETALDKDAPVVSQLTRLVLPWTAPVEPVGNPEPDKDAPGEKGAEETPVQTVVLAKSSPKSWTQPGPFNLNPQQRFLSMGAEEKEHPLIISLSGRFKSAYAETGIPRAEPEAEVEGEASPPEPLVAMSPETQIVVVGSSFFMTDEFLGQFPTGGVFVLNTVDWLTMGEDLIGIRTRGIVDRPLREVSEGVKSFVKFANIFAIPILVAAYGLVRVYARRRARKIYGAYGV